MSLLLSLILSIVSLSAWSLTQDDGQKPVQPSPTPPAVVSSSSPADSTRVEVIKAPRPNYPKEAAKRMLQGRVWIALVISKAGDVESTEVISGEPSLALAAAEAMKNWQFKPFIQNGKPARVSAKIPYDFALESKISDKPEAANLPSPILPASPAEHSAGETTTSSGNGAPVRVRISARAANSKVVHRVEPFYPDEAKWNHIQGEVLLDVLIGTDGRIHDLRVISGPPVLVQASVEAVQQWRYQPYTLQGKPVEVETTIRINFHM